MTMPRVYGTLQVLQNRRAKQRALHLQVKHKYVGVSILSGTMSLISVQNIGVRMVSTELRVFL